MGWERFYTAKSLEDTGKTVDEVEWSRRPDLTFYFLDAKGDMVQIDPEDGSFSPMWVPMSTCRFLLNSSRVANAKFKIGDKVIDKTRRYMGAAKIIDETDDEFVVKFDSGPRDMLDKEDAVAANSRVANVRSRNSVVVKALNACARNGAYDTLEIRKDPRYGNNWCIYQEGVNVRAVSRVFDTPQSAKKYIREQMPAWADAKIRVKNACGTARNAETDVNADLRREIDRLSRHISDELKKHSESYAYWMEADCGRWATGLLEEAKRNKDVEPSLIEEIKRQRRRVDDAIAASKKLPR